jgi:hypothetical protein
MALSGFDPSRDGFDHARLTWVASHIARMAILETDSLARGMWNPLFCAADASQRALDFFASLRGSRGE